MLVYVSFTALIMPYSILTYQKLLDAAHEHTPAASASGVGHLFSWVVPNRKARTGRCGAETARSRPKYSKDPTVGPPFRPLGLIFGFLVVWSSDNFSASIVCGACSSRGLESRGLQKHPMVDPIDMGLWAVDISRNRHGQRHGARLRARQALTNSRAVKAKLAKLAHSE